jgi:hypothetical protein
VIVPPLKWGSFAEKLISFLKSKDTGEVYHSMIADKAYDNIIAHKAYDTMIAHKAYDRMIADKAHKVYLPNKTLIF